jgi:hypothetical protein
MLLQKFSRIEKGEIAYRHHQLDGIVVLPTIKAPGQIDLGVDGGMEAGATGALKTQDAIRLL